MHLNYLPQQLSFKVQSSKNSKDSTLNSDWNWQNNFLLLVATIHHPNTISSFLSVVELFYLFRKVTVNYRRVILTATETTSEKNKMLFCRFFLFSFFLFSFFFPFFFFFFFFFLFFISLFYLSFFLCRF